MAAPVLDTAFEMTYRVKTTDPIGPMEGSPGGPRQFWQIAEGSLSGRRINALLFSTGVDWMNVDEDGFWRPDVRAQFLTSDGAVIFLQYTGLVQQTHAFKTAANTNKPTDWTDQYMRLSMRFDTGDDRYRWLNESLFVARGRLEGTGSIEYAVFRIN